jgi:hypothetical protein
MDQSRVAHVDIKELIAMNEEMEQKARERVSNSAATCGEPLTLQRVMVKAQILDTDTNARRVSRILRASGWRKCRSREHGYIWKRRTDQAHDMHGFECLPPAIG